MAVAILTEDMKRLVREQGLGFYAIVCEDGSPNLLPKGTTRVWDDDHLFFADIRSPQKAKLVDRVKAVVVIEASMPGPSCRPYMTMAPPAKRRW